MYNMTGKKKRNIFMKKLNYLIKNLIKEQNERFSKSEYAVVDKKTASSKKKQTLCNANTRFCVHKILIIARKRRMR